MIKMTLDEAIKHCNEVACKHDECATEHKQLAQWLMELKSYKEQKPANKVEPKFKVGDWIVSNEHPNCGNSLMRIVEVGLTDYLCQYYNGQTTYCREFIDKKYRLWTIQDAKDGDVLAVEAIEEKYQYPFVAIYKEHGLDFFNSYCYIGFDGKFYEADAGHSTDKIHPATKEQCDILFKKMTDAGYTFDFEKKELREIEQKPAWSEEDEKVLHAIRNALNYEKPRNYLKSRDFEFTDILDWLKSLKDRVQTKPKQEWSEEDESLRRRCIGAIDMANLSDYTKDSLLNWLKSLRPQNNATDEELAQARKDAYNDALDKIEYHSGEPTFDDGWSAAIWYLKKRNAQPQNTWKPSDEQMMAINTAINVIGKGTLNGKQLIELREQLKRLKGE